MTRTETRELVMQAVFQMEIQKNTDNELLEQLIIEKNMDRNSEDFLRTSFENVRRNIEFIDSKINEFSKNWTTSRMPKVDLAILRTSVAEMIYDNDTPNSIVINEAVEMAKKFSDEKSRKFINGLLGSLERSLHEK